MRNNNSSSFSLVELTNVISIIGILCAIGAGGLGMGCVTTSDREASATRNAKEFAASMGMEIHGVSCSGSDSDQDGYVSCTLNLSDDKLKAINCGYDQAVAIMGQNTGCKLAMPINVGTVQQ